jgi:CheY-like chemotaxis protein
MHRRQHDANFTALKGRANSGHIVDVVALTVDDDLLATLQDAVGTERTLWHAPSADAAVDLLIGGRCGILVVDLQVIVRSDTAALLERLQHQFPELVLLATGRREEEGSVAALISSGCVCRFLHKPVSPARAAVFLATATRRHHELSGYAAPVLATVKQRSRPWQGIRLIAGAVGLVVVLASALIWSRRDSQLLQPAAGAQTNSIAAPSIDNALAAARAALAAGRLSPPQADNALDHYRLVLLVQADNATALAGIQEILRSLAAQVTVALQNRNAPAAKQALMVLQKAQPDHPQLEALRGQLLVLSRSARPETAASASKPVQLLKSSR